MKLKLVVSAMATCLAMAAAPVQTTHAAADPAEACGAALLKVLGEVLKGAGKGAVAACKGKSISELDAKLVAKVNKAGEKLDKLAAKIDCATNQDPDNPETYPVSPVAMAGQFTSSLETGFELCNGVNDP